MRFSIVWALVMVVMWSCSARSEPTTEPARRTFLVVPLHIHVLRCAEREDLDCKLTDEDVHRIIGKVNGIWHKAGIHFRLEPILHEQAENVKDFSQRPVDEISALGDYRSLRPAVSRALPGLHVYYIHQFAVNGVYLGGTTCFVKETAKLRPVNGGIDEPIPRVTAHELGHAMGLPHRQDVTNLMASGNNGTTLNAAEVEIVCAKAQKIAGALTVAECEAEAKGDSERAQAIRKDLEELLN